MLNLSPEIIQKIKSEKDLNQRIYKHLNSDAENLNELYPNKEVHNFLMIREFLFTEDLINLFNHLGVDFKKDNEYVFTLTKEYSIIEIWFDFIGELNLEKEEKNLIYEADDYSINIFFNEKSDHGKRKEWLNKETKRIEISIVKENHISN